MLQPILACDTVLPSSAAPRQSHPLSMWGLWLAVILAVGPFIVRRIILLGDDDYVHWMAIDYLARSISLIGVILGFRSGHLQPVHALTDWPRSLLVFLLLLVAELAEQAFGCPVLEHYFRFMETSSWPPIPDLTVRVADLSIGLLFAVFVEELVFRKFMFAVIELWFPQRLMVIILSAAVFAFIHFTSGVVDTMVNAFVHGIFFGIAYWTTRRLSVCVASHYLIDLLIFNSY
jgi:membrane protease YdiL (CAAX protease family)